MGIAGMRSGEARWLPLLLLAPILVLITLQAAAQNRFPALTGRVVDTAGMLPAEAEARIAQRLRVHETATGEQIVVVTIPTLDGNDIETYTLDLAREWGIGTAERNDGVVFLVAQNDRKMRIEVGYGLEEKLTDAAASLIIRLDVAPEFRNGNFAGGIEKGVDQILKLLEATDEQRREWESREEESKSDSPDWSYIILIAFFFLIFFGSFGFALLARIFGRKIQPGHYRWLGMDFHYGNSSGYQRSKGGWSGGSGGWSGGRGGSGFSGGGGSFGGGGASGSW